MRYAEAVRYEWERHLVTGPPRQPGSVVFPRNVVMKDVAFEDTVWNGKGFTHVVRRERYELGETDSAGLFVAKPFNSRRPGTLAVKLDMDNDAYVFVRVVGVEYDSRLRWIRAIPAAVRKALQFESKWWSPLV